MNSMHEFFLRIKNRPFVYFGVLIVAFITSTIEAFNPIIKNYGSFDYILERNYIQTLSGWTVKFEALLDSNRAFASILLVLILMLIISAVLSIVVSGHMNVFVAAVEDREKTKGEFTEGLKRNFFKTLLYFFVFMLMTLPLVFLVLYSAVPTLFMVKQLLDGDTGVIFTMLLMALLTLIVALFAMIFYAMYFSYVLPSIAGLRKRNARAGIKMTNTYAWYLLPKTMLFLFVAAIIRVLLFVMHYGHQSVALSIVVLMMTAILRSFVYYIYFYFVFNTFVAMRDDLYPDYMEDEPIKKKTVTRVPGQRKAQETAIENNEETDEFEESAENTEDFQYDQDDDEYDDSFEV